jgi:hypothetical protein
MLCRYAEARSLHKIELGPLTHRRKRGVALTGAATYSRSGGGLWTIGRATAQECDIENPARRTNVRRGESHNDEMEVRHLWPNQNLLGRRHLSQTTL